MVRFIYVDFTEGIEAFHGVDGAIDVSALTEHRVESQNDIEIDDKLYRDREYTAYLRFVLLATSVEVQRDQVAKHVLGSNALPILLEI